MQLFCHQVLQGEPNVYIHGERYTLAETAAEK